MSDLHTVFLITKGCKLPRESRSYCN